MGSRLEVHLRHNISQKVPPFCKNKSIDMGGMKDDNSVRVRVVVTDGAIFA